MASLESELGRWIDAGLLDAATADRIREYESERRARSERPTIVEGLAYLGIAIVGVGIVVLLGTNWEHLGAALQTVIPAGAAIAGLVLGYFLGRSEMAELRRGGPVAWLLALVLASAATGITFENAGLDGPGAFAVLGTLTLAAAVALWIPSRTSAQLVGVAGAMLMFSISMQAWLQPDAGGPLTFALTLAGLSAIGLVAAELEVATPILVARTLFGLGLVAGGFFAAVGESPPVAEVLGFVAGGALIWLSLSRGVFIYIGYGIAALFLGLVTVIIRHVGEPTIAALALIVVGLLLIAGVVVLARLRPWVHDEDGQDGNPGPLARAVR
jgi:hypothetical protein